MPKPNLIYKKYKELEVEINNDPSLTVKGETYTIGELFERAKNGLEPEETIQDYIDVEDIDQINHFYKNGVLDLTDLDAFNNRLYKVHKSINDKLEEKRMEVKDINEKEQENDSEELFLDTNLDTNRDDSPPSE